MKPKTTWTMFTHQGWSNGSHNELPTRKGDGFPLIVKTPNWFGALKIYCAIYTKAC